MVKAYYSACCGGHTSDIRQVWPNREPAGYLHGVPDRAASMMTARYPGATIRAIPTPMPLLPGDSARIAETIRAMEAGIVLVALGAPRQERWILEYLEPSGANVAIAVGSAFDIICGDKRRAPGWMQRHGLEWLHRMLLEPRRLGKRYSRNIPSCLGIE